MTTPFSLTHDYAVIIGGTGVLGNHIALALSAAGAPCAILGRNAERGQAVVDLIKAQHGESTFHPADTTQRSSLEAAQQAIAAAGGTPSILLNAAGGNDPKVTVTPEHPFAQLSVEAWRESFELNVIGGALLPCQVFGPAMCAAGRGSIINIASVSAHLPLSRVVAYSAGKAAVLNLTQFLAREWAPHGVRVNSLTPGFFPAEQNRRLLFEADGTPTPRAQSILGHTPMKRFGRPEELGGAVVFLASPAASFVTGIDLRVDGGFLAQTI
jgi:NAD(P)-dependent dehydrogenase (short-subunit alcohol dehydrogenase family)